MPSSDLDTEPYVSLTTFRRDGTPVPTAVWAAPDGAGHLLVWTGAESGKVTRLRHTAEVTVAPCDRRGRATGDAVPGTARLLPAAEMPRAEAAMARKYGLLFRLTAAGTRLGRLAGLNKGQVGVELTLRR
ncbi:MAG TPA: PPOX class F420-dependent oxidoreductase [Mycobacteriales bacterium]